ncbi:Bug family tripartite tricarboxylate transporter substrate binding protein [Paracandidimonas soli]|uniref:Tripartite-type tricarboxylate transporter receptor subunit TctC n=1 Tax=Paracandidimonas soli TaxID=1917182 RepID=A0A4R3VFG8_9BURK|nr:tripartite tricarboxylate transporter substrate binding protein [Paracandidimonas soli]TCV02743.1 tripartite-type tricarboxylate transporter receptor subunit TctC [Paracandidimonas soli]
MKRSLLAIASLVGCIALPVQAASPADSWPDKPVTVIMPYAAGGSADVLTRIVFNELAKELDASFVIENRPGAGGTIATTVLKRQKPDGYTLGYANVNTLSVNPSLFKQLPYDPNEDFEPVGMMFNLYNVLAVRADHPAKTAADLLKLIKDNPGKFSYGASGIGTSGHIGGEQLRVMAGLDVQFVPYQGDPQSLQDLVGGRIEYSVNNSSVVMPLVETGKLRALAITALKRVPLFPDIPTFDESGIKGYENVSWGGIVVPKGTPQPIIDKLNAALNNALRTDSARETMSKLGAVAAPGTPADFRTLIRNEQIKYRDLIESANIPKLD